MNKGSDAKLLPCPFCSGAAALVTRDLDERYSYGRLAFVLCGKCGARTADFYHDDQPGYANRSTADPKAINAWNARALRGDAA